MNQAELNRIATSYLKAKSIEVARKIDSILDEDLNTRVEELNGPIIHHIHNEALFYSLMKLNNLALSENSSKNAAMEFYMLAESLKPKFFEIIETLKDFEFSGKQNNE